MILQLLATAQSIAMRQMNFDSTVEEIARKPPNLITQDDARVVQSMEVSILSTTPAQEILKFPGIMLGLQG